MTIKISRPEALAIRYLKGEIASYGKPLNTTLASLQRKGYAEYDTTAHKWVLTEKGLAH